MLFVKKSIRFLGFFLFVWLLTSCGTLTNTPRFALVLDNPTATGGTASAGTVSVFSVVKSTGVLSPIGSSVQTGKNPTAITSDLHGRLLYVANTSDGSVSAYGINRTTGNISSSPNSPFATGTNPINVVIDTKTRFLFVANQGSNTISAFKN